ncbi:PepSY domain-containing protein [Xylophilus ampelinus]|uniref:Sulfite reductase (NADPH) flavoprotein alpha-component n=1 Tax=Xylophilus ampelinus TaxID=54067 RepID=A0A318SJA4_9BURK|nr:sulfite reductase flavoprotein subunit alpha [Xylophilus ampelinus]MCS4510905.1 sulfite reductase flavoprotein subunit alpha [Xylophilus ampelinus]PYE76064.1 sulfite reductase (NADPH) flavoprotein alpha-component [Xylophilus ampelinus]
MPLFKTIWFQLHWCVGITAGTVLIVIGLSGATLSFQGELLDLFNPASASMPLRPGRPLLTPQQLVDAARGAGQGRAVQRVTVFADPTLPAQIVFVPLPGQRRGLAVRADPVSGEVLPAQRGAAFFDWAERLHRWLLLPRDTGKSVTGTLAACLLLLALSGLYLRWPRRPLAWRTWLTFDTRLAGRSFLWGLHSVLGTWALAAYVVFTLSGLYWAFDAVRVPVDRWAGAPPHRAAAPRPADAGGPPAAPDLASAWISFARIAHGWQLAQWRLPERAGQPVQIFWMGEDAAHDRARNRLHLRPDGSVLLDERYADLPRGQRFLGAIYPLHLGSYFGLPGRIAMMLAGLCLPLFVITGWMLYLGRRRAARAVRREREALQVAAPGPPSSAAAGESVLVAFASQSGRAERLAVRTVAALRAAGAAATLAPVTQLGTERLRHHRRVLLVASTFGEGDPPDMARRFARILARTEGVVLPHLKFGLLALGDRQYAAFCGCGHGLVHHLQRLGAQPLFPPVEMDGEDPAAWTRWQSAVGRHLGLALPQDAQGTAAAGPEAEPARPWRLAERRWLNPGSLGAPLFRVVLTPPAGVPAVWQPGALVEVFPRHAADVVTSVLRREGWDGTAPVAGPAGDSTLAELLAGSVLPAPGAQAPDAAPQQVADGLRPLAPRRYSVASLPADGTVQLLVRQVRHDAGLGLASGWLSTHSPVGAEVAMRLEENPDFALADGDGPAIFIGSGSGYAGLRALLTARMRAGHGRNWLLFGERQRAHDSFCEDETAGWQARGLLAHRDFAYSRDQAGRVYVQDCLRAEAHRLRGWIGEGATLYVCGSLDGMAAGVYAALAELLGADAVEDLIADGRYRRDVY